MCKEKRYVISILYSGMHVLMSLFVVIIGFLFVFSTPVCSDISVIEKLNARNFPSILGVWAGCRYIPPGRTFFEMGPGLAWGNRIPEGRFEVIEGKIVLTGDIAAAREIWSERRKYKPNMIFLMDVPFSVGPLGGSENTLFGEIFPDDYAYWVPDRTSGIGSEHDPSIRAPLIDFTHPKGRETLVGMVKAVDDSEFYDGIFLDWWNEAGIVLDGYRTLEEEFEARIEFLKSVRDVVSDDFLIVVNSTPEGAKYSAPYINGLLRETFRYDMPDDFEHLSMLEFEAVYRWSAMELRYPQIPCFEGEGIGFQSPLSPENLQDMRCLTTLYLTHSDGFFSYTLGVNVLNERENHVHDSYFIGGIYHENLHVEDISHEHHHTKYCYDFWDVDLGRPVGEKFQLYDENIEGLFIREFTNGWVIYNRSGEAQDINLRTEATGASSGIRDIHHTVSDLDGEIYIRVLSVDVDLNGDGVVNILDLVIVASDLGVENSVTI